MAKWVCLLENGMTKTVEAKSEKEARNEYYGSQHHFSTELGVVGVAKKKYRSAPAKRDKAGYFDWEYPAWVKR